MMPKESNLPSEFQNLLSTQLDLVKHDLNSLKQQNEQDHDSLISKFTLLTTKHDSQLSEVTERADELARCFELMRESVEAVEGLIEKMQGAFVSKLDENMQQVAEDRKKMQNDIAKAVELIEQKNEEVFGKVAEIEERINKG